MQKLTSFYNSVTDVQGSWGTGNDSLSCGPPWRGPSQPPAGTDVSGGCKQLPEVCQLSPLRPQDLTPMSQALHKRGVEEAMEASTGRSKLLAAHYQSIATTAQR